MIDKVRKTIEMSAMMMNSGRSGGGGGGMPDQSQIALDVARSAVRLAEESAAGLADANTVLARMREEKSGLEERVAHLERMDRYHDGGSTPGSHNTVTQQRIAGERKKQKEKKKKPEPAKGGPQKGHKGAGRAWRPEETITCRLDKCTSCGCTALEVVRQYEKMLILLELGIVSIKAYHVHEYTCAGCGAAMSDKPDEMLDGTTISRSLLVKLVRLHRSNKSMSELCETAEIAWGVRLSRAAVSNGIRVAAALLRPEEDRIREAMGRAKAGNPDETRLPIGNDLGYLWACIADKLWVLYHAATSRKRSVLWEMGINPEMKVTSDAYSAYKFFKVLQLCWAHVKTKVKNAAVKIGTPVMKYLYGNLMAIHRHATTLPPGYAAGGHRRHDTRSQEDRKAPA